MKLTWHIYLLILVTITLTTLTNLLLTQHQEEALHNEAEKLLAHTVASSLRDVLSQDVIDGNKHRVTDLLRSFKEHDHPIEYLYVTDTEHAVFAHSSEQELPHYLIHKKDYHPGQPRGGLVHKYRTEQSLIHEYSEILIPGLGASLYIGFNQSNIARRLDENTLYILEISIATTLLMLLIAYFWSKQITGPLTEFAHQIQRFGAGETVNFSGLKKNALEIHQLATAFQSVIVERQQVLTALQDSQAQIHLLLNSTAEAIHGIDLDGKCTFVNQACLDMLGYKDASELLGRNIHDLIHHHYPNGSRYPEEECNIFRALRDEHGIHCEDEVLWRKDGSSFAAEYWSYPIIREEKCIGAVVTFLDITDRIEALKALQESEQDLAITLNSIGDAVITTDALGHVNRMNPVAERLTGWSFEEAWGLPLKTIFPIIDASTREPITNPIEKVMATGETVYLGNHTTLIAKDGTEYQIADSAAPIRNGDNNIQGMVLIFNDVTEQYQLRQAAAKSKRDLQAIMKYSPAVIHVKDTQGRFTFINRQFEKLYRISNEEVIGKTLHDIFQKDIADEMQCNDKAVLAAGHALESEIIVPHDNGLHNYISIKFPLLNDTGDIYSVCCISTDITERKKMEDEIRSSAQHLRLYREQVTLGIIEWNTDFQIVDWNPAAEKIFGYTIAEVKGRNPLEFLLPENTVVTVKSIWHALISQAGGESSVNENHTKDGRVILCEWHNTLLKDESGKAIGATSSVRDITAEHQAQQALLYKEHEQREILNSMVNSVITIDENGSILTFNKAAETLFGYEAEEIIGQTINRLMPEQFASSHDHYLQRYLETGVKHVINLGSEVVGQCKNKETFPMYLSVAELPKGADGKRRFIGTSVDLTQIKQQEEQLHRSEKMSALGKLTGGIAHDFNNLLGVITGYAELLEESLTEQPKLIAYANQIHHAGERGAKLTKKLLAFSQKESTEAARFNINTLLLDEQHLLKKTLTVRIKLVLDLDQNLWPVWLESGGLEDAVLNISINALHAMECKKYGQLTIQSHNESVTEADAHTLQIDAGDYVLLSIIDIGCGMDESTKKQIFDPFFSTKDEKGTGLGLTQVYGFVKRSGGTVKVYSELGQGTKFTLYFPRYHGSDSDAKSENTNHAAELDGTETILVVDDESVLLDLTAKIISKRGYNIIGAKNAKQALEILGSKPIDLLLSDVVMPGMDGYQLVAIVQEKYPSVKILMASGFSDARHVDTVDDILHQNLLHKPYRSETLFKKIRGLLSM